VLLLVVLCFQMVMSSDSIAAQRAPVLLLNLTLRSVDGSTRNVAVELSKADVDALVTNCDKIQDVSTCARPCLPLLCSARVWGTCRLSPVLMLTLFLPPMRRCGCAGGATA
jgi:hypothetical protein